ncbi:MAG: hypothetical protein WC830_13700 [Burkholderiales bacterium]|jgi:hypothetical protein
MTAGSKTKGLPQAFAMRKVTSASSATSNSRSRTTRLNAVCATFTSAKSSVTSSDPNSPAFNARVPG